jgi:hypothetical protein
MNYGKETDHECFVGKDRKMRKDLDENGMSGTIAQHAGWGMTGDEACNEDKN